MIAFITINLNWSNNYSIAFTHCGLLIQSVGRLVFKLGVRGLNNITTEGERMVVDKTISEIRLTQLSSSQSIFFITIVNMYLIQKRENRIPSNLSCWLISSQKKKRKKSFIQSVLLVATMYCVRCKLTVLLAIVIFSIEHNVYDSKQSGFECSSF